VEDLASHGYIVVTMDHTHDSEEVQFPGGRLETAVNPGPSGDQAVAIREADTRFVLDQLTVLNNGGNPDADHTRLPQGLRGSLDLSRIGMFGWSLGGATAAATMLDDARVKAGVDLDGTFFGPVADKGLTRPFMLMSSSMHSRDNDPTWASFWANSTGWKRDLNLADSQHQTYSDLEELYSQIGPAIGIPPDQLTALIGTIDPRTAVLDERVYVRAFFDLHLRNDNDHLLDGPSARFPDIQFVP
jgi:hypothetical protein